MQECTTLVPRCLVSTQTEAVAARTCFLHETKHHILCPQPRESWCRTFQRVLVQNFPVPTQPSQNLVDAKRGPGGGPAGGHSLIGSRQNDSGRLTGGGSRSHATRDGVAGGHAANRGWGGSGGKSRRLH